MSDKWIGIFAGIVMLFLLVFAGGDFFDLLDDVLFTGTNAAADAGNVTGEWADLGITLLWFGILIFLVIGTIALVLGRGGS